MTDRLVTIASGHTAKLSLYQAKLESEGILSFIADESMVRSPARLQVKECDAEKAAGILGIKITIDDTAYDQSCPFCHSTKVKQKGLTLIRSLHFMFSGKMPEVTWKCHKCGREWKGEGF
jgi:hypothetical protein